MYKKEEELRKEIVKIAKKNFGNSKNAYMFKTSCNCTDKEAIAELEKYLNDFLWQDAKTFELKIYLDNNIMQYELFLKDGEIKYILDIFKEDAIKILNF